MLDKGQSSFGLGAKWGQLSGGALQGPPINTHSTPLFPCLCCPALQYPEADILTSSDHLINTNGASEGLERWPEAASAANIGIMLFRPKGHDLAAVGAGAGGWGWWVLGLGAAVALGITQQPAEQGWGYVPQTAADGTPNTSSIVNAFLRLLSFPPLSLLLLLLLLAAAAAGVGGCAGEGQQRVGPKRFQRPLPPRFQAPAGAQRRAV